MSDDTATPGADGAADPFGRAVRDHHRGDRTVPLYQRDGERIREHPIEAFYFEEFTAESPVGQWLDEQLEGPLLDVGAGAGRHTRYFQTCFETVAVDVSEALVETMRERGISDARIGDMFSLPAQFEPDRFASVLLWGTQLGLVKSGAGLRAFLSDLAAVTESGGTAVVDGYDPTDESTSELLGYREDPTPGQAFRVMHFEYEDVVGETLLFGLFSPDRVRAAATKTGWRVTEVRRPESTAPGHYCVALANEHG